MGGTTAQHIAVLSKALDLDAGQQAKLRVILEQQRDAVRKIWSDPALLASERTPATRAVGVRTANEIRAILNEDQKKKYNPPPAPPPAASGADVESWMAAQRTR